MTTVTRQAVWEEMIARVNDPRGFGRTEAIASLTTLTAVVTALAYGSENAATYTNRWLVRMVPTTTADRIRLSSTFAASTGTLTHAGANYADTTATGENIEIMGFPYEPAKIDNAINVAAARLKFIDIEVLPCIGGQHYWLSDFSWITSPGDVPLITRRPSRVLSRNPDFAKWAVQSASTSTAVATGSTNCDWWTLAGTSSTIQRTTTNAYRQGQATVTITRAGTNCTFKQSLSLLNNGIATQGLAGKLVGAQLIGLSSVASQLRIGLDDGVTVTYSSYHTGGGANEELTVSKTLATTATKCDIIVEVNGSNTAVTLSRALACSGAVDDDVRRDDPNTADGREIDITALCRFDQSAAGNIILWTPESYGLGMHLRLYSYRGYPSMTTDAATIDAPLVPLAIGALYRLYEGLAASSTSDTTFFEKQAKIWHGRYNPLAERHMALPNIRDTGLGMPPMSTIPMARRYGTGYR